MPALPVLTFITFLVLKLTETVDWSWWVVTSPLWIFAALVVLMYLVWAPVMLWFAKDTVN